MTEEMRVDVTIHVPEQEYDHLNGFTDLEVTVEATLDDQHTLILAIPNDGHLDREAIGSLLSIAPAALMQAIEQLEAQQ